MSRTLDWANSVRWNQEMRKKGFDVGTSTNTYYVRVRMKGRCLIFDHLNRLAELHGEENYTIRDCSYDGVYGAYTFEVVFANPLEWDE